VSSIDILAPLALTAPALLSYVESASSGVPTQYQKRLLYKRNKNCSFSLFVCVHYKTASRTETSHK